jgi:hypothetical protein
MGASGRGGAGGAGGAGGSGAGGGGGSSGSASGAGSDAGEPGEGCAGASYLLCEDFEATQVGQTPSGWQKRGDPVAVADDEAASGTHALKIGPRDNGERRISRDAASLPTTHWGRVRFKVQLPVPDAFVHSTLVAFSGRSPAADMAELEVRVVDTVKESVQGFNNDGNGSHFQVLYNVQPQSRGEFATGSSYDWRFDDAWHCAEWYIDSAQQAYRFFLDGTEIDEIAIMNGAGNYEGSEIPSAWQELRVGWNNYQAAPPGFTAWIDDFALDDQRIECE